MIYVLASGMAGDAAWQGRTVHVYMACCQPTACLAPMGLSSFHHANLRPQPTAETPNHMSTYAVHDPNTRVDRQVPQHYVALGVDGHSVTRQAAKQPSLGVRHLCRDSGKGS
jgi:hypothetical protein